MQCNVPCIEEDKVPILLALTLIQKMPQAYGIVVIHTDPGDNKDRTWMILMSIWTF